MNFVGGNQIKNFTRRQQNILSDPEDFSLWIGICASMLWYEPQGLGFSLKAAIWTSWFGFSFKAKIWALSLELEPCCLSLCHEGNIQTCRQEFQPQKCLYAFSLQYFLNLCLFSPRVYNLLWCEERFPLSKEKVIGPFWAPVQKKGEKRRQRRRRRGRRERTTTRRRFSYSPWYS